MSKILKNYAFLAMLAAPIVLLDQLSKQLVRSNIPLGNVYQPGAWLSQYVRIIHWKNTGMALGLLQEYGGLFTITSTLITLGIIIFFPFVSQNERYYRFGLALMLGGALGNLLDRFQHGYVLDFFSVGAFPVINLADVCISSGVAVIAIGYLLEERRAKLTQSSLEANEELN